MGAISVQSQTTLGTTKSPPSLRNAYGGLKAPGGLSIMTGLLATTFIDLTRMVRYGEHKGFALRKILIGVGRYGTTKMMTFTLRVNRAV